MQVKLERDRSLVESPCLRVRTKQSELFIWWFKYPRFYLVRNWEN